MLKIQILFGAAAAVQNADDNMCRDNRSCWTATAVKYDEASWPFCISDDDCDENHYCVDYQWEYNEQIASGTGCFRGDVCMGTGA